MLLHLIILSSKEIIASILWHIWKARNHFTFCQQWTAPDPLVDVALAKETLYRHSLQQSAIPESPLLNPNRLWTPPDQGSYKANIDGAFTPNSNTGAIACVLRDHAGILIDGFSSTVRVSSPLIVESDCLTLVETLNDRRASPWEIRAFVADVSVLRLSFPHLRIRHCRREANAAADWAAKAHARKSISPSWPKFPPAQLVTFLCIEMPYLWDVHFVLLE